MKKVLFLVVSAIFFSISSTLYVSADGTRSKILNWEQGVAATMSEEQCGEGNGIECTNGSYF